MSSIFACIGWAMLYNSLCLSFTKFFDFVGYIRYGQNCNIYNAQRTASFNTKCSSTVYIYFWAFLFWMKFSKRIGIFGSNNLGTCQLTVVRFWQSIHCWKVLSVLFPAMGLSQNVQDAKNSNCISSTRRFSIRLEYGQETKRDPMYSYGSLKSITNTQKFLAIT